MDVFLQLHKTREVGHDGCTNSLILFKKYTTDQNQKCKDYAFKGFLLDCSQKMTKPARREDENDSGADEKLASPSTAPIPPPHE